MSTRTATKSGNLSDSTVWGATFNDGDILIANGFNIAIDVNKTIGTSPPMRPSGAGFSALATGSGGSLAAGTWYVGYTDVNAQGESTLCPIASVVLTSGQTISVTLPALPTGVVSRNIYVSVGLANPSDTRLQATGITATGAGAYIQSANPTAGVSERTLGAIAASVGSVITVNSGVTVTLRGDFNGVFAFFTASIDKLILTGTAKVRWDASLAVAPTTTSYRFFGGGKVYFNGSAGNVATMDSVLTNGAMPGVLVETCLHGQYLLVTSLGDASRAWASVDPALGAVLDHYVFDTCGDLGSTTGQITAVGDLSLTNGRWKNSVGPSNFSLVVTASTTGLRSLTLSTFDKTPFFNGSKGFNLDDAQFLNAYANDNPSNTTKWSSAQRVLCAVTQPTPDTFVVGGDILNWALIHADTSKDGGLNNPHNLQLSTQQLDATIDGVIYEYAGTGAAGQFIGGQAAAGPRTTTVQNCIKLPNAAGSSSGSFINMGAANSTYIVRKNTVHVGGSAGSGSGMVWGEANQGHTGELPTQEDNIFWDEPSARDAYNILIGSFGAQIDTVTPAGAHNNGRWNVSSPASNTVGGVGSTAVLGYSGMTFSVLPESGSFSANPTFVDRTRNMAAWDLSLGGPGTIANALAEMAKRNDPAVSYNSAYTVANYRAFVRAGYAPQNIAYFHTAHDGTDIGAVPVATASPVATTLVVTTQPGAIASGARHAANVAVQVLDQFGSPITDAQRYVSATLTQVSGGTGTPFGTLIRLTSGPNAVYNGLYEPDGLGVVSMAGGTYKWSFTSYKLDGSGVLVPGSTIGPFNSAVFAVAADVHAFDAGVLTVDKLLYPLPDSAAMTAATIIPKPAVPNGGGYEATFDYYNDYHWGIETTPPGSTDGVSQFNGFYYDAAWVDYARAERCKVSDPTRAAVMYARADQELLWYRDGYVLPNNGKIRQEEMFFQGLAIHYLRTHDYASRLALNLLGQWGWEGRGWPDSNANALTDFPNNVRPTIRAYQSALFCSWLNIPAATAGPLIPGTTYSQGPYGGAEPPPWSQIVAFYRPKILAYSSNGRYPGADYCGHNANFQIGLLAEALIDDWYISGLPVATVLPTLQAIADYLITQWSTVDGGFHYLDGQCDAATGVGSDSTFIAGDLSGLMVVVLAWVAWQTGGSTYQTVRDDVINKMNVNGYQPGHKQFNQLYRSSYKAVGYKALSTPVGVPDHTAFVTQPAGAVTGLPLSQQPVIELRATDGSVVTSYQGRFKALLVSGNSQIIGDTVYAVNGRATYTTLRMDGNGTQILGFFAVDAPTIPGITANPLNMAPSVGGAGKYGHSLGGRKAGRGRRGHR